MFLYSKLQLSIVLALTIHLTIVNSKSMVQNLDLKAEQIEPPQSSRHIRRLGGQARINLENEENKNVSLHGDAEAAQTPGDDRILLLTKKIKILTLSALYFLSFYRNPLFRTNINYKQVPTTTPKPYKPKPPPPNYEYKKPEKPKYAPEESKDNYMTYKPQPKPSYEEKYPTKPTYEKPSPEPEKPYYKPSYKPSYEEEQPKYKPQKYKSKPESEEDEESENDESKYKSNYKKSKSKYKKKKPYKKESEEEEEEDCVECEPSCEEDAEDGGKY